MFSRIIGSVLASLCLGVAQMAFGAASTAATNSFSFRLPQAATYTFEPVPAVTANVAANGKPQWLRAQLAGKALTWLREPTTNSTTNFVLFGSQVVVQLAAPGDLQQLIAGHDLQPVRTVAENVFILQAPDAWTAATEAQRLAALPEVRASYPMTCKPVGLDDLYASAPTAAYFLNQYYLENRNPDGTQRGADMNVRAAWPYTRGAGVTVAIGDTGYELDHPDLAIGAAGAPHHSFLDETTNGMPPANVPADNHGTAVAGFISAQATNLYSIVGMAPDSRLASWVVIDTNGFLVPDDRLMEAFQFQSNVVQVQNHSWGELGQQLISPGVLTSIGISNAVTLGRNGRGSIITRSGGNNRALGGNADDDGFRSDPRVIAVASARVGGRAASYSNPGACLLVSAVGGDPADGAYEFTTDRQGALGYNPIQSFNDPNFWNFAYTFYGTSASAPQIAGIAALMLSANPNLAIRDVQQILILSARHFDFTDPDLTTNGGGFVVSHNIGFGLPDAGVAVQLARGWSNRPPVTTATVTLANVMAIPDDGLRLLITGPGVPPELAAVQTVVGPGPHADIPTAALPLVDFGFGTSSAGFNLTNKAALIERQTNSDSYASQVILAAQAGAAFAVFYNYTNTNPSAQPLTGTDFVPIPVVFINLPNGVALRSLFATNASALAQIRLFNTNEVFTVTNTLLCEHVGLRVMTDHPLRGDLRFTLVSPSGTRSVLQRYGPDTSAGPGDWTYYSTHDFFESSYGNWTAYYSDESTNATGNVLQASLVIYGTQITDTDHDGLDDNWELAHFGNLAQGPKDDPDHDGYSNMREYLMGTDPNAVDVPFKMDFSFWDPSHARLSWPGRPGLIYQISAGQNPASLSIITNIPTHFPVTDWITGRSNVANQFFRVRALLTP